MELILTRHTFAADCSAGSLSIDGAFFCDTLEPTDRGLTADMDTATLQRLKVKGATAIPTGSYDVSINIVSQKAKRDNDDKYSFCGYRIPRLLDVPAFDGILIHIGNFPFDTEGCILVGDRDGTSIVTGSTAAFNALYRRLLTDPDNIRITVKRQHAQI